MIEITVIISVVSVSAALFFGIKSAKRADISDIEERTRQNTEIKVKLDESISLLKNVQDELKSIIDRLTTDEKKLETLSVEVVNLERRVDRLEKGGTV